MDESKVTLNVSQVPQNLIEKLKKEAEIKDMSISALVRTILKEYFKEK